MPVQTQGPVVKFLIARGTRAQTKELADGVSILMTQNESAKDATTRAKNQTPAVLYNTLTKDLTHMTTPGDPSYVQGLCRDWKGGWWYVQPIVYDTEFDRILAEQLMADTPISTYKPGKSTKGRSSGARRAPQDAKLRAWVPYLAAAQGMFCAGCGKDDPRAPAFHVDHIQPLDDGGETKPGNMQLLCVACNLAKSNKSMPDLWKHNERVGMMWDKKEAIDAHKRARIMKVGP